MYKSYDGHTWSRTITSNIINDLGLTFHTSSCLGHLPCDNIDHNFLTRVHQTTPVNETKWEEIFERPFDVGSNHPSRSTVICKLCKVLPICLAVCPRKDLLRLCHIPYDKRLCVSRISRPSCKDWWLPRLH